jgi:hypothetical protein
MAPSGLTPARVLRRLIGRAILVALFAAALIYAPKLIRELEPKSYEIVDADVQVQVRADASLAIRERLTFDFNGDFKGGYRDIPLARGAAISRIELREGGQAYGAGGDTTLGSEDRPGSFGATSIPPTDGEGARVVWHYRASDEQRTFELRYRVRGAAVVDGRTVTVPWAIWGDQWDFWLDELSGEIVPPRGAEPEGGVLTPAKLGAEPEVGAGVSASIERVPQQERVVLLADLPRSALGSVTGARPMNAETRRELDRLRDETEGAVWTVANAITDAILLLSILWTALLGLLALALYVRARERPTSVPSHLPEPPEEVTPALAYALATEGGYDDRIVLATLLDLVDRGFYEGRARGDSEDLDLALRVPGERPATESLKPYELETLEFFDGLLGSKEVELGKLKDEVPEHSSEWRGKWNSLNSALDRAEEGELEWDRDLTGARRLLTLVGVLGYALLIAAYFARTEWLTIPLTAALAGLLLIYLLPATELRRLDPAGRERHARWHAFARWTHDFPRLHDDPPATLKLWRRVLVYAVALGSAERVAESGRIPAPVAAEASSANDWTAVAVGGGYFGSSFNSFGSGFSSHVAPEPSSSSGGGGGGGGGVSGGGGGGAW